MMKSMTIYHTDRFSRTSVRLMWISTWLVVRVSADLLTSLRLWEETSRKSALLFSRKQNLFLTINYCTLHIVHYFFFFLPYLTYWVEVWGNANKTTLQLISTIQKRAVRAINSARYGDFLKKKKKKVQKILINKYVEEELCWCRMMRDKSTNRIVLIEYGNLVNVYMSI